MKKYITPIIRITESMFNDNLLSCSCGCCIAPDGSHSGGGCWGCPNCSGHSNQGNHNCTAKSIDYGEEDEDIVEDDFWH